MNAIVMSGYFDFEDYERCGSLPVEKGNGFWQQWCEALVDLLPADERENNLSARELGRVSTNPLNTADFDLDSDPRPYQFLKSRLKKFGIEVLTAADAAQGLRVGRSDMPSMILAAHLLPDGNAEHLLWKLRSRPRTRQLLVFITAETLSKYSQDNLKREVVGAAGIAGFFTKPLDTEVSYAAIERYFSLAVAPANRLAALTDLDHALPRWAAAEELPPRLEEMRERLERRLRNMMLDALGVGLGRFGRHAECAQDIDDEPMANAHAFRQPLPLAGEEHAAIWPRGGQSGALEPRNRLDCGGVGDAEAACNISRARLADVLQEVGDQLDIVFQKRRRLRRAGLAEPPGLGAFGRQLLRGWSGPALRCFGHRRYRRSRSHARRVMALDARFVISRRSISQFVMSWVATGPGRRAQSIAMATFCNH